MKEIGVRNLAWATPVGSGGRDKDKATVTVRQGDTLAKLAARLGGGITMEDLRRVNPQLADIDQLPVGMDLNPPTTTAGDTPKQVDEGASPTDAPSPSANWDESRFDGAVYRAFINSPAGHFGNFGAYTAAPVSGQQPDTSAEVDPRFKAVNQALQAGNATNAIAAAKELIAALQSEKPPQRDLLNHAHMALASASLLNNDPESAGKALRTISPGTLEVTIGGAMQNSATWSRTVVAKRSRAPSTPTRKLAVNQTRKVGRRRKRPRSWSSSYKPQNRATRKRSPRRSSNKPTLCC